MKTFILRSVASFATILILVVGVHATGPTHPGSGAIKPALNAMERDLERALGRHLAFPFAAKGDMTGEVFVSFVIDAEGRVEILDSRSENARLKDHVLRKLARVDLGKNPDRAWRVTHMRIRFLPERDAS